MFFNNFMLAGPQRGFLTFASTCVKHIKHVFMYNVCMYYKYVASVKRNVDFLKKYAILRTNYIIFLLSQIIMLLLSILFPTQELKELCYFVFTQCQKIVMVIKLFFLIPNINIFDFF